jgi:predicted nuclease with TOPRIM domain
VSGSGGSTERPDAAALIALERAVEASLQRLREASKRAQEAEARVAELQRVVDRFTGDPADAERLVERFARLEDENADLRTRVAEGRAGVERLLAKIRFLENQR